MTPRDFLDQVVRPNVEELCADDDDVRKAVNAVNSMDNLVGQMFVALGGVKAFGCSDWKFREDQLAANNPEYRLVRDLANALKHGTLDRNNPLLSQADVSSKEMMWGDWDRLSDVRHLGGPHAIVVTSAVCSGC